VARWSPRHPLASDTIRYLGNQWVHFVEETLGEEIDARLHRVSIRLNEEGFDPFGFDPEIGRYALASAALLHRYYFRTEVHDIARVPQGRALIVGNHSGQIPVDGMLISTALMLDAEPPRLARNLVERWTATLPGISVFFPRSGQVVGSRENAQRLLEQDEALIVFPEGVRGIAKPFHQRYQLTEFGPGFVRLALETKTPIVPVAIVGGEEQYISVANLKRIARLFRVPVFPVIPQLFTGFLLPLPTRYRLYFGEPIYLDGDADDEDSAIEQKVWVVKSTIQSMLKTALGVRKSVFW